MAREGPNVRFNRRAALKAIGASAAGFSSVGIVGGTGDDSVTITVVEGSEGPRVTKEVSREWYEYEQLVDAVAADARRELGSRSGVKGVGIGSGKARVAGRPAGHIRVYVPKNSNVHVPDEYRGIPVEVVERGGT